MVVFPLLSRPRHKTLTSFFSPSHPTSLSNSPIGSNHQLQRGLEHTDLRHQTSSDFTRLHLTSDIGDISTHPCCASLRRFALSFKLVSYSTLFFAQANSQNWGLITNNTNPARFTDTTPCKRALLGSHLNRCHGKERTGAPVHGSVRTGCRWRLCPWNNLLGRLQTDFIDTRDLCSRC